MLDNYWHTSDQPVVQESSFSASKERILCEPASNLEKAVEEMDNLECEPGSLNKEVGS
jgi:hypothetical protein